MSTISFFKKPSVADLKIFLENQKGQPFSYPNLEATRRTEPVENFNNDYQKLPVGHGSADFELAKKALQNWVHFPFHWTQIQPGNAKIEVGNDVCVLFQIFGMWWKSGCRIIYKTDEPRKFGFAYGTLPSHIERGEELFQVEMDENDTVWYEIRAFSQPRHPLVRLVKPLARLLQEKFRRDSADAVRQFVKTDGPASPEARRKFVWRPDQWILALLFFVVGVVFTFPGTFFHHDYGKPVLFFAVLISSPVVLHLLAAHHFLPKKSEKMLGWMLPAGAMLAAAQVFENQILASFLAAPWLVLALIFAFRQIFSPKMKVKNPTNLATTAALIFWVVGSAWAFADPAGIRIFNFSDEITRLTALHFHFAGLALPILAGLAHFYKPDFLGKMAIWLVIFGVPLTAVGITSTQIGGGINLEVFAGVFMSVAGVFTAIQLLKLGISKINFWLVVSGSTLFFTMLLSFGYALRPFVFLEFLNINWMRAVHGSLNALVAVPCGLIGFLGLRFGFEHR